jgi:hypothetical protein
MYYVETKAICCHTDFGQFLGSHQTLEGEGGGYFCRFYLAVVKVILELLLTNPEKCTTYIFHLKQICRDECTVF